MASILKRGKAWRAQIIRKGYKAQHRTFDTMKEAQTWAKTVESKMMRRVLSWGILKWPSLGDFGWPPGASLLADEARGVDVRTTAEELAEQLDLVGRRAGGEFRQSLGSQGLRSRIKCREFVPKRGDSGLRGPTLRFELLEFGLYLRELCDESLTRCGRRDIRNPFVVGPFHDVGGNEIR